MEQEGDAGVVFLTNICPQNHSLNSGGWKRLEEKVRLWADRDSAVIVVSGPIVQGHINRLESGVAVPTGFFKVLLAPFATRSAPSHSSTRTKADKR